MDPSVFEISGDKCIASYQLSVVADKVLLENLSVILITFSLERPVNHIDLATIATNDQYVVKFSPATTHGPYST